MNDPSIIISMFIPLVFIIGVGLSVGFKKLKEILEVLKEILEVLKQIRDK
jgi:hypothetical protein